MLFKNLRHCREIPRFARDDVGSYKEIHTALLESAGNRIQLAKRLHTTDPITLPTHLGKFLFNGLPLTLERLSQLSSDDASTQIGEPYDVLLPERQPNALF